MPQLSSPPRKDRRPVAAPRRSLRIYGFLSGLAAGLVTGLGIAVAAALYLTNSPVPFVNKVQHATESLAPEPGDPNRPLFSPLIPGPVSAPATTTVTPNAVGAAEAVEPVKPLNSNAESIPPGAAPATTAPGHLMLQAGAFKNADDADVLRARLALLGLDAKVVVGQADGTLLYRVRLGPYEQFDDLDAIRRTLSENGMEAQLLHVQ